jgi:hypothetical protein
MKSCLTVLAAAVVVLGTSFQAQAGPISLSPAVGSCAGLAAPCLALSGTHQSNATIIAAINARYPGLGDSLLYKATQSGGGEDGAFAAQYQTLFNSPTLPNADATISWDGGSRIHASPVFALIKDGKLPADPGASTWYFYDISGWDGTGPIAFSGFFGGNQGKISHVAIYGTDVPTVPDGGSMAILLGLGLLGLASLRRLLK